MLALVKFVRNDFVKVVKREVDHLDIDEDYIDFGFKSFKFKDKELTIYNKINDSTYVEKVSNINKNARFQMLLDINENTIFEVLDVLDNEEESLSIIIR